MKIVLIYSPFAWPSAPPLGMSLLKSFLESSRKDVSVNTLDLNLNFFTAPAPFIEKMCSGCSGKCVHRGASPSALLESGVYDDAVRTLSSFSKSFFDPATHAKAYLAFRSFYEKTKICAERIFKSYAEGTGDTARAEALLSPFGELVFSGQKPVLAGFSCHSDQAPWSMALAKWVKKNTGTPTVVGGYFPSFCEAADIVKTFGFIDYAVAGEGEYALEAVLDMSTGNRATGCEGVFVKGKTPPAPRTAHPVRLDELPPPDFSGYNLSSYFTPEPVLPILASRGCQWGRCAFCAHRENYAKSFRERSVKNVVDEIRHHKESLGVRHFLFCDEQVSGPRLEELSDALSDENIIFGLAGLKPDATVTAQRLGAAHEAGCRWVYLGVETLTQRLLDRMKKGTSAENVVEVVKSCGEAGIIPFISYMWGFPGQRKEDVQRESELLHENAAFFRIPDDGHGFTLEKGSPVSESPDEFDVEIIDAEIMFKIEAGKVFSGRLNYRPKEGLTPHQAMALYQPDSSMPWESHSFWESLLLLAERNSRLVFDRTTFHETIAISPDAKAAGRLEKMENLCAERRLDLARCMIAAREYRGPLDLLVQITEEEKNDKILYAAFSLLGELHEEMGDIKSALPCYLQSIERAPNESRAPEEFKAAQCMEKLSMVSEAAELYKKCAPKLHRRDRASALRGYGTCIFRVGRHQDAVDALLEARTLDYEGIHSLAISFALAGAYDLLGMNDRAQDENSILRKLI